MRPGGGDDGEQHGRQQDRQDAGARARIVITADAGATTVVVSDDGPGPGAARRAGYGLVGLAERVAAAGGTVAVAAGPNGTGTVVTARLPVPHEVAP